MVRVAANMNKGDKIRGVLWSFSSFRMIMEYKFLIFLKKSEIPLYNYQQGGMSEETRELRSGLQ